MDPRPILEPPVPRLPTEFPHHSEMKVRWRDVDVLGHVNNAVYFTYFETARVEYLEKAFPERDFDLHLVSVTCEFLLPLHRGDVILVGARVPWVGRTSFCFEYGIRRAGDPDRLVARGVSVQVLFERGVGAKRAITPAWLDAVARVEGRTPGVRAGAAPGTGEGPLPSAAG